MATLRTPTKTWVAREADFYLARRGTGAGTVYINGFTTTQTLSGTFATSGITVSAGLKNITVTPPETGWDKQDFLGQDSNGFQNQLLDEKPVGIATVTGTLILGEDELVEDYIISGTVTAPSGYSRYQVGKNNDTKIICCVSVQDGALGNGKSVGLDNARFIKWGDIKLSGPDAHFEQDISLICLAKDFYYEVKD